MKEAASHRPAFEAIPAAAVRALTRLLPEASLPESDAATLKVVLQGLTIIVAKHWVAVLEELQQAVIAIGEEAAGPLEVRAGSNKHSVSLLPNAFLSRKLYEVITKYSSTTTQDLTTVDIHSTAAMTSEVGRIGRSLERCTSCLWEGVAQLVMDRLKEEEPYLEEAPMAARTTAAAALDAMQTKLELGLWKAFSKAADWAEEALRSASSGTASTARVLPAGVGQLQPFVEAFFLFGECSRAVKSPLDVLVKQEFAEDAAPEVAAQTGASPSRTPARLTSWLSRSHSQHLSQSQSSSQSHGNLHAAGSSPSKAAKAASPEARFLRFAERHRRLLNLLVHHSPALLTGPLALLMRAPKLLDFDNK